MAKVSYKCETAQCPNEGIEGVIEVEEGFSTDVICVCGVNIGKAI